MFTFKKTVSKDQRKKETADIHTPYNLSLVHSSSMDHNTVSYEPAKIKIASADRGFRCSSNTATSQHRPLFTSGSPTIYASSKINNVMKPATSNGTDAKSDGGIVIIEEKLSFDNELKTKQECFKDQERLSEGYNDINSMCPDRAVSNRTIGQVPPLNEELSQLSSNLILESVPTSPISATSKPPRDINHDELSFSPSELSSSILLRGVETVVESDHDKSEYADYEEEEDFNPPIELFPTIAEKLQSDTKQEETAGDDNSFNNVGGSASFSKSPEASVEMKTEISTWTTNKHYLLHKIFLSFVPIALVLAILFGDGDVNSSNKVIRSVAKIDVGPGFTASQGDSTIGHEDISNATSLPVFEQTKIFNSSIDSFGVQTIVEAESSEKIQPHKHKELLTTPCQETTVTDGGGGNLLSSFLYWFVSISAFGASLFPLKYFVAKEEEKATKSDSAKTMDGPDNCSPTIRDNRKWKNYQTVVNDERLDLTPYKSLKKAELTNLLSPKNVKPTGNKSNIIIQLIAAHEEELWNMNITELKGILKNRGLKTSGSKKELVFRIIEAGCQLVADYEEELLNKSKTDLGVEKKITDQIVYAKESKSGEGVGKNVKQE